jgi:sugar phosphate isomerase/epimerase
MELILIRHLWGAEGTWEEIFPRARAAGYRAIEAPLPEPAQRGRFQELLDASGLAYVAMIFSGGAGVEAHIDSFHRQLDAAAAMRPILINSHSGSDAWGEAERMRFFEAALAAERAGGGPVAHETHRGRATFSPWATDQLLGAFPDLRLCCDLSHWVCVCERLIDDQLPIIERCAERCIHLHARVGYEQGPQVPDPRAPEYARHLAAHERWWQLIWDAQEARGDRQTTLTPEYGPPGYLHTLPYTNMPVADLAEVCDWMAQRESALFAARRAP